MKSKTFFTFLALLLLLTELSAQPGNQLDAVWARSTAGATLTLDGKLDEAAWSKAEAIRVRYPSSTNLIPGSGWKDEGGVTTTDSTDATIKFLVQGNWLWLGITCKDKSIGGKEFNQFDGFLMNLRDHSKPNRPAPHFEIFYAWLAASWADPKTGEVGALPGYFGSEGGPRDSVKAQIWNAATTVVGLTNSDSILDESYTSEIAINLTPRGYDVTRAAGDIVELNISIYDADWQWPFDAAKFSSNRTWLQGPWGNANWFNVLRIHARPDVTINSTSLPTIGPEIVIPNGALHPDPTVDGRLDEAVWQKASGLDLRYGDAALRNSYPSIGPYRSGEFQPEINGVRAAILDPADATIKWFFKGDKLYLGVDVRDQAVWGNKNFDQWDGIRFIINDRSAIDSDSHVLERRNLEVHIDSSGALLATGDLANLVASGGAQVSYTLKPNSTLNDFLPDEGYQIELAVDLTQLGYPAGRGDGVLFISATLFDGDNFANPADNYGNRVWWMRENPIDAAPAWAYMDPAKLIPVAEPPLNTTSRLDAIWALNTAGATLTLDGKLNETAWSKAQTVSIKYPQTTAIIPGSGWKDEGGVTTTDPTDATIKFLVQGNWLWLGITCKDKSIGGKEFNQFDGFLMNLRDHSKPNRPAPHFEIFYAWLAASWADPKTGEVGALPGYFGSEGGPRDSVKAQIWNAATTVVGLTNSDSILDESYTSEIAINLTPRGYDVTRAAGDIIELNISIYDADWQWPFDAAKFSSNRTWLQGPWGNANWFNVLRIHARPDVTINSTSLPTIGPEVVIPNAGNNPAPTIDGRLNEGIWQKVPGLDLRYGDAALRNSYPSIGPYRSGEFQPEINGVRAAILDPADATIKGFFKDNMLYLGVDVRDQAVWGNSNFDQWDGIRFIINDRSAIDSDSHVLERRNLEVHIDPSGALLATGDLPNLVAGGGAQVAFALKPNTTLNNFNDADEGYWIEMALDLTQFGYPAGLGDGVLFISATLFDGDNFANAADNYGNRVWWMRENPIDAAPAWALMDKGTVVSVADRSPNGLPEVFTLYGNYPNPFNPATTISFGMPEEGVVTLRVYDLLGRSVMTKNLGMQSAGRHELVLEVGKFMSGVYFYRLEMTARGGKTARTLYGRMMLLK